MAFQLSPIVAGMWRLHQWQLDAPALARWIEQAVELGVTSFDHADIYGDFGNEAQFGAALAAAPGLRERLQIVTKCGIRKLSAARPAHKVKCYDSSRAHVLASVDHSLAALRTDRIDLLLIHRPDLLMDPDELAVTFGELRAAGKVLHFGLSNHTVPQFAMLHRRLPLVTHQVELSPLQLGALDDGTLDQATDLGLRPMIWSPLAGGRVLTGDDEAAQRVRAELETLGRELGVSVATVAYAWILRHPSRPLPISGSQRLDALREAQAALSLRLSGEQWYRVLRAATNRELP